MSEAMDEPDSRHYGHGRTAAQYVGCDDVGPMLLLNIYESWNRYGEMMGYHYEPRYLREDLRAEVKTIGSMPFDRMVRFAQDQFHGLTWRRLR